MQFQLLLAFYCAVLVPIEGGLRTPMSRKKHRGPELNRRTAIKTKIYHQPSTLRDTSPLLVKQSSSSSLSSVVTLSPPGLKAASIGVPPPLVSNNNNNNNNNNRATEKVLLRIITNQLLANVNNKGRCPEGWGKEMCNQPSTFYLWLRELREQEVQQQLARAAKGVFEKILAEREKHGGDVPMTQILLEMIRNKEHSASLFSLPPNMPPLSKVLTEQPSVASANTPLPLAFPPQINDDMSEKGFSLTPTPIAVTITSSSEDETHQTVVTIVPTSSSKTAVRRKSTSVVVRSSNNNNNSNHKRNKSTSKVTAGSDDAVAELTIISSSQNKVQLFPTSSSASSSSRHLISVVMSATLIFVTSFFITLITV